MLANTANHSSTRTARDFFTSSPVARHALLASCLDFDLAETVLVRSDEKIAPLEWRAPSAASLLSFPRTSGTQRAA